MLIYIGKLGNEYFMCKKSFLACPQKDELISIGDENDCTVYKVLQVLHDTVNDEIDLFVKEWDWEE